MLPNDIETGRTATDARSAAAAGGEVWKARYGCREECIATDSLRMAGNSSPMGHTASGDTHASAVSLFPLRWVATTDGILAQLAGGVQ